MHIASKKDFWSSIVILVLMAICWNESHNIDTSLNFALGPLFFPYLLMGSITFFSLILLFRSLGWHGKVKANGTPEPLDRAALVNRLFLVGFTCLYIAVLPFAGYTVSTLAFLFIAMCFLGRRGPRQLLIYAIVSAAMTFGLYWIFSGLLHLFLP